MPLADVRPPSGGTVPAAAAEPEASPCPELSSTCSTTLKWSGNGELSALDHQRILERLCAVDPAACQIIGTSGVGRD